MGLLMRVRGPLIVVALVAAGGGAAVGQDTGDGTSLPDSVPAQTQPTVELSTLDAPAQVTVDPWRPLAQTLGEEPGTVTPGSAVRGTAVQVGPPLPADPDLTIPPNSGSGRRVIYSNARQRLWVVDENETLVKTHRVSGKTGWPRPGNYTVYSRSLYTHSAANPAIKWRYMVRFAAGPNGYPIGFHEIPSKCGPSGCFPVQTPDQLGQPLSGGCLRQSIEDAIFMWEWAQLGTPVIVLDNG